MPCPSGASGVSGSAFTLTFPGANLLPACGNSGPCRYESFPHRSEHDRVTDDIFLLPGGGFFGRFPLLAGCLLRLDSGV